MAAEEDDVFRFEAVYIDPNRRPWSRERLDEFTRVLGNFGLSPSSDLDVTSAVAGAGGDDPIALRGPFGRHLFWLMEGGDWWWDTPYETLMVDRHENRPEVVDLIVAVVRALLSVEPPFFGAGYVGGDTPVWADPDGRPFIAEHGSIMMFFSKEYLDVNHGGRPYDPPVPHEALFGGQLLVMPARAFGASPSTSVLDKYFRKEHR